MMTTQQYEIFAFRSPQEAQRWITFQLKEFAKLGEKCPFHGMKVRMFHYPTHSWANSRGNVATVTIRQQGHTLHLFQNGWDSFIPAAFHGKPKTD